MTTKRLILLLDREENKKNRSLLGTLDKIDTVSDKLKRYKENIVGISLSVIVAWAGIKADILLKDLHEEYKPILAPILHWARRLHCFAVENRKQILVFLCLYLFWLALGSIIMGYRDLKPMKRIFPMVREFPHFRYFIIAALFAFFFPSFIAFTFGWFFAPVIYLFTFLFLWEVLHLLLFLSFKVGWYRFARFLYKKESPPKARRYKVISLKDVLSTNFCPPSFFDGKLDEPTETRPRVELNYQNDKSTSFLILRLRAQDAGYGDDLFERTEIELRNYHTMVAFEKTVRNHAGL